MPKRENVYGAYYGRRRRGDLCTCAESRLLEPILRPKDDELENSYFLFHGTRFENVQNICENGFDISGRRGAMFGHGIYLSQNSSKSDAYCSAKQGVRCLVVVRAAIGRVQYLTKAAPTLRECPEAYHAVCGENKANGGVLDCREYVIFSSEQVVPEFLIWYRHDDDCPCSRCDYASPSKSASISPQKRVTLTRTEKSTVLN